MTIMKLMKNVAFGGFAAGLLAMSAFAQANLVTNGSFEADLQSAGTWNIYANLTGWTGGADGIELRNNIAGAAYDGVNYVELDTNINSASSQVLGTTLGQKYTLSFAYAPREGTAASTNGIEVFWNGVSQGTFSGTGAASGNAWVPENLTVTGTSPTSNLEFRAVGISDSYGGSLDAVSLTAIPEPESYAMMLAGLGLLGFVARRRRERNAA
jgi:hypothetical protein